MIESLVREIIVALPADTETGWQEGDDEDTCACTYSS